MELQLLLLGAGFLGLIIGAVSGYYARQSLVKKRKGTIEARLARKALQVKKESEEIIDSAKKRAAKIIAGAHKEIDQRRRDIIKAEGLLFKREHILDRKISDFEQREKDFAEKVEKLKVFKEKLTEKAEQIEKELKKLSGLSKKEAKEELLKVVEKEFQKDLIHRMKKLKEEGEEAFKNEAQKILSLAIQKYALPQSQEITTSTIAIASDKIKGRVIGKEGRNIKTFEKLTGVEIMVDETPATITISCFNPIRRQVAKIALERLIQDGRIQPARIEEQVKKAKEELNTQIEEFGRNAVYEVGILDLPVKLINLLGRLYFRTSYGQNVLSHSMEVALLSAVLAEELGANVKIAKKAGLLHDIGKAIDREIEGSHVEIGIKILEKFGIEEEVIEAMKAHHEDYEAKTIEAVIVKTADQISGARPGARKDTVENYLKRLEELEKIAQGFKGVKQAYAIQAGREVRVFVKPEEIDDLETYKLAKDIAAQIQQETNYPGEIKVNVIRETRVVEYAR